MEEDNWIQNIDVEMEEDIDGETTVVKMDEIFDLYDLLIHPYDEISLRLDVYLFDDNHDRLEKKCRYSCLLSTHYDKMKKVLHDLRRSNPNCAKCGTHKKHDQCPVDCCESCCLGFCSLKNIRLEPAPSGEKGHFSFFVI
jgi:hypothetical protein